ncbi:AcrR family transcriptional regulator [Rhizobium leguminosarum]|uniref:AcrR family transcriptional regulator n=1 Tax=Rhizobium leguminosarum TaxID=384 RepID=A0AAE2STW2_RHILE|nr:MULTISPECIES: TetR family transcriptional regulator [Rhizobium]MBB4288236.1 AcrR family transcriptional regulator [Rhizobium leguminosarum]MBB4295673.1 AcrR family transcriptional regulator [Rhizobium leguminosarum]MBB4307065.1 AcrR family transcriptional regulator [Rhizobium leguminosarum]MBB4417352.1 AcrR family transcriptional regulator [Rhizobium leguminosarum]MBB4432196.1 AcrR family transcriptional regulator [Rhizobium esperanzae]
MAESKRTQTGEGRRERKRRQTRERIEQAAVSLFLRRGFEATTIEDITEAADVSKRSFFDYFPSKEEVVFAWQDSFADRLTAEVAARPASESSVAAVEAAIAATVIASVDERGLALAELIHDTPALKARDQLKYARLEQKLAEALLLRKGSAPERSRMRVLAAVVIGALRVGSELWQQRPPGASPQNFAHEILAELWNILAEFGDEAKARL